MELVRKHVNECVLKTSQMLGSESYLESCYQRVLAYYLRSSGKYLNVNTEYQINYRLPDGYVFGYGRVDILIETFQKNIFIIEVKQKLRKLDEARNQLKRYVRHIKIPNGKIVDGQIVNFFGGGGVAILNYDSIKCNMS